MGWVGEKVWMRLVPRCWPGGGSVDSVNSREKMITTVGSG